MRHREFLISSGGLEKRRKERAKRELMEAIENSLTNYINNRIDEQRLEKLVDDLFKKRNNPYSAAQEIVKQSIKLD